jgi:hypothetical protein
MDLSSASACLRKLQRRASGGTIDPLTQDLLARCGTKEELSKDVEVLISVVGEIFAQRDSVEWELTALALLLASENEAVLRDLVVKSTFFPFLLFGLDHNESRVRQLCIRLLMPAGMILEQPLAMHEALAPTLLARIREKFVRSATLQTPLLGDASSMPLDDTTGWSTLESYVSAYFEVLKCCGYPTIIDVLSDSDACELLITQCSIHRNRFVREAAIGFIQSICELIDNGLQTQDDGAKQAASFVDIKEELIIGCKMSTRWGLSRRIAEALKTGLEDNWSRIRQASCKAALVFLAGLAEQEDETRRNFMAKLLPGICLNRFYAADGVKATAADTWRGIVGSRGREWICALIESFATSYAEMSKVNNHMISEAACSAMAELISRIDRSVVQTQLPRFVEALGACLADDSWPVRDSSCVATGVLLRHFGKEAVECDPEISASFLDVCARHLKDAVWSLRENAALALGDACRTENTELSEYVKSFIASYLNDNLGKAVDAAVGTRTISFLSRVQLLALEKNARESAASPPSAPPNSKKVAWRQGGGWGCCLDCMETRTGDSCDISSGAVYLLREFAGLQPFSATQYLETLWSLLDIDCAAQPSSSSTIASKREKFLHSLLEILPDILLKTSSVQAASDSWKDVGRNKVARLKMCDSASVQAALRNII